MRTLRLFVLGMLLAAGGCDGCSGEPESAISGEVAMPPLPEEVPQPGSVYREAYDTAKRDINLDNAHDRLDELERQVVREREALE